MVVLQCRYHERQGRKVPSARESGSELASIKLLTSIFTPPTPRFVTQLRTVRREFHVAPVSGVGDWLRERSLVQLRQGVWRTPSSQVQWTAAAIWDFPSLGHVNRTLLVPSGRCCAPKLKFDSANLCSSWSTGRSPARPSLLLSTTQTRQEINLRSEPAALLKACTLLRSRTSCRIYSVALAKQPQDIE